MDLRRTVRPPCLLRLLPPLLLFALLAGPRAAPAAARPMNAGELARAVERLGVVGNVLYVAAHPDDENTRLIAYLANERLLRTAYLSLTRGDGGQNLIGSEQGPLLGLIRTQELLAARRIDGGEQIFTRARDFGYSKSPEETLRIWDRDAVLADVVLAIRRFKPDVIITRFPPGGAETHGHHTASAILAEEAFKAAADPAFHKEQVAVHGTWQARRLLWNKSSWMKVAPRPGEPAPMAIDAGGYNPLLGLSYGEMAADSRSMHKSQGFGSARSRGPAVEQFVLRLGEPARQSLFEGIDQSWGRLKGTARLQELLVTARRALDPAHPDGILPTLFAAQAELQALPDNPWKGPKLAELAEVIAACAGLHVEATAGEHSIAAGAPGGELPLQLTAINRSPARLDLVEVKLPGATVAVGKALPRNEPVQVDKKLPIGKDAPPSGPYWLVDPPGKGLYTVADPALIGVPERPALVAEFALRSGDRTFSLRRPVTFKWVDDVAGERHRPVEITPPVMVRPEAEALMFPGAEGKTLRLHLTAGAAVSGTLRLELPPGWRAEPPSLPFRLEHKGAEDDARFKVVPPAGAATACASLRAVATIEGDERRHDRGLVRITHPHIPIQTLFPPAEVRLCRFDLRRTRTRIGYIAGAGDEVPAALRQAGYEVTLLDEEALSGGQLGRFEAIVIGVRAYNVRDRLPFHHKRLMDYVAAGGTVVAQYNTSTRFEKLTAPIGPHPFEIGQERVTDEGAAVTFALPNHPVLSRPNKIGPADFEGWVQERGLYFAVTFSDKYEAPLAMNDPGEPPRKGSLIVCRHGKGAFVYTGLAFFRQLPAGVPGAYRLFSNLISYGK